MPVQLGGSARPGYMSAVGELFSLHPDQPRKQLAKQVALQSVRVRLSDVIAAGRKGAGRGRGRGSAQEQEQLDGFQDGNVPLRIRPALVVLNALTLVILGLMGFHPRGQAFVPFNDKVLHFACFFFATALFYCIWDVDEPARRVWIWRHMPLILTWVTCFAAGGLGSEFVQSLLPYKTFQWGDVFANLLGSGLGLFVSYHAERRFRIRREIERLYEPLDQELYGDGDSDLDEGMDDLENQTSAGNSHNRRYSSNDAWRSADDADQQGTSSNKRVHFEGPTDTSHTRPNDSIFSLADDDEDDDQYVSASRPPLGGPDDDKAAANNVWAEPR